MLAAVALGVGLVVGFVFGWLVRDESSRPLTRGGDDFGLGVPGDWVRRQDRQRAGNG